MFKDANLLCDVEDGDGQEAAIGEEVDPREIC